MQKHHTLILLLSLGVLFSASAQHKFDFSIKGGVLAGRMKTAALIKDKTANKINLGSGTAAISFALPIGNFLYFGAEVGQNSVTQDINDELAGAGSSSELYIGNYHINQYYFAVVPEYRFMDMISFKVGAGYFNDFDSYFEQGSYILTYPIESIGGYSYKRRFPIGYFAGIGLCPQLHKDLGMLMEVRYLLCGPGSNDGYRFGYNAFAINFGLSYRPN